MTREWEILLALPESRPLPSARRFAKCFFVGHSAKTSLPRAALGKVPHSTTRSFTECRTLGTETHFFAECWTLSKGGAWQIAVSGRLKLTVVNICRGPVVDTRQRGFFARVSTSWHSAKTSLPSAFFGHSTKYIFIFKILSTKLFVVCSYTM
jgi:hypothetical protein